MKGYARVCDIEEFDCEQDAIEELPKGAARLPRFIVIDGRLYRKLNVNGKTQQKNKDKRRREVWKS